MKKRFYYNSISSIILQIITVISGFVIPRLIIEVYGSDINGLVNSITQFLSIITVLDFGIGELVRNALYKPLYYGDNNRVSQVATSALKYFRVIAKILVCYVIILCFYFSVISTSIFKWQSTVFLILSIAISQFMQFYFGIVNGFILHADQKGYVRYSVEIITVVVNLLLSYIFISAGFSIQLVKLSTSLIFIFRPIFMNWYVKKNYNINWKSKYDRDPIDQKWNGFAQHISTVVLDNADIAILTLFTSFSDVSIYSVYHLVISGVKGLFVSATAGVSPLFGRIWAEGNKEKIIDFYTTIQWIYHNIIVYIFSCTSVLIIPFVSVYTKGITDANYIQETFALLIVIAFCVSLLRYSYSMLIFVAERFKDTQSIFAISAFINVILSIILVRKYGLIGVAVGTVVAMLFQMITTAVYCNRVILGIKLNSFWYILVFDVTAFTITNLLSRKLICYQPNTYINWIIDAFIVAGINMLIMIVLNMLVYRKQYLLLMKLIKER